MKGLFLGEFLFRLASWCRRCDDCTTRLFSQRLNIHGNADSTVTFGEWGTDHYQCGDNLFCFEVNHSNTVDGKEHVFYFYDDNSDTIEDDKIYGSVDEAFEAGIDYDFLNAIATMLGKDPIK